MWISRKEYKSLVEQVYTANVILQSYKQMEEQAKKLDEECEQQRREAIYYKSKYVQQEQQNRLLCEEIDRLKARIGQLENTH